MDGDARQSREMKILTDILALALDEAPGVSASAIEAVRQRARLSGVTGGAIKDAFLRARADIGEAPASTVALARARARIEVLQSQVLAAEDGQRRTLAVAAVALRRARLLAWLAGLVAGAALTVLVRAM